MEQLPQGQTVKHVQYGLGVVTQSDAERTSIDFHLHGPKKFATKLMVVDLSDEAIPPKPPKARAVRRRKAPLQIPPFTISVIGKWVRTSDGIVTNLPGDLPTASFRKGLTSGRMQWDWFSHVDTNPHVFDPFVNFGLANGRMDQHFLPPPFDTDLPFWTLGYWSDWEGEVHYKVWRRFTVGFSVSDVLPMGPQRIYSNIVWDQADESILAVGAPNDGVGVVTTAPATSTGLRGTFGSIAGDPNHGRFWNSAFENGPA
jgi:hypothetical protein